MNLFSTLNSFENFFLKPESREKLAQKILAKTLEKWGLYRPNQKLAVRLICQSDRPSVDRPVDRQQSKIRPLEQTVDRPADRNKQRALLSGPVGRPADRPCGCQTCTSLCTSVDPKGRPALGAVDPCGRPTWPVSHCSGQKHMS